MNPKTTLALAAAVLVLGAAYFLASPPPGTAPATEDRRLISEFRPEQVERLEILPKGAPEVRLERAKDPTGEYWRVVRPFDHPADPTIVQQLLYGLDRFQKTTSFEPGRPEAAPAATGLADPRLRVVYAGTGKSVTLRFGGSPSGNAKAVFVQRDGDAKVYLADLDTVESFNKPAWQYRSRTALRFAAHAVTKAELEFRFLKKTAKDKPAEVEFERSVLERIDQGPERGWWLVQPHREKLDDHKAQYLVRAMAELEGSEFQPAGDLKGKDLDPPQVRMALTLAGVGEPVRAAFGGPGPGGRRRWIHVPGAGEAALIEDAVFEKLPLQRKHLRTDVLFPYGPDELASLVVEAGALGSIRLERRETKKPGEAVPEVSWTLAEPAGLRTEKERIEGFLANLGAQRIQDFLGAQDFKLARLDPPDAVITARLKDGRVVRHSFGLGTEGFLRKEGIDEVFVVRPELVKILQRLELNFLHPEVFNVPRESLREFSFEARIPGQPEPVLYRMRLDAGKKAWIFSDPVHSGKKPDEDRLGGILAMLNYIKAENFIAKDPETAAKHRLDAARAPARLRVLWDGGPESGAEFYFSDDLSDKPTKPAYYARRADAPAVFQVNPLLVEHLKRVPVLKE